MKFERFIQKHLGTPWCGLSSPPGDHLNKEVMDMGTRKVFYFLNDGMEFWIGYPEKWLTHMRSENALKMAWVILWRYWVCETWFGLRRKIWYWALFRIVNSYPKINDLGELAPPNTKE